MRAAEHNRWEKADFLAVFNSQTLLAFVHMVIILYSMLSAKLVDVWKELLLIIC